MNWSLLKNRNFFLLTLGKFVSLLASNILQFALSLYVLDMTNSALAFGSVLSILIVPRLILSPIAGVLGDRFSKKKLIVVSDLIDGVIIAIYSLIYMKNGLLTMPLIYILVMALEITEIFFGAGMAGVVPLIIDKGNIRDATAIQSVVGNIGQVFSPMIGAALYGFMGMKLILIFSSIGFLLSGISELFIDIPRLEREDVKISLKLIQEDLLDGLEIIKSSEFISAMILVGAIGNFFTASMGSVGGIYVIREIMKISEKGLGLLEGLVTIPGILAPILFGSYLSRKKDSEIMINGYYLTGYTSLIMGLAIYMLLMEIIGRKMGLILFMTPLIITSTYGTLANISFSTMFRLVVPIEALSRVSMTFNLVVTVSIPIGQLLFGLLLDKLPAYIPFMITGVGILIMIVNFKNLLSRADEKTLVENI